MIKKLRAGTLGAILSFALVGQFTVGNLATLTVVTAVPIVTGAATCSKDQLLASAEDVLDVVTDNAVIAALQTVSAEAVAKLRSIEPTARSLVAAIRAGDTSTAIGLINTIFPVINELAAALHASQKALGVVALANIALHFIINHVKDSLPKRAALTPEMVKALSYGNDPAWGCDYHKKDKRCN